MPRQAVFLRVPALSSAEKKSGPAWLAAAFVYAASLTVYVLTLAPTITFEDSGEFVTAAATTGIPHPPGYPLWCLLARLFTMLPGGAEATAWKVNLLSAFIAAMVSVAAFLLVRSVTESIAAAAAAGLSLAFSRTLWSQSVIAEVYSLNALLFLTVFFFLYKWWKGGRPAHLYLCSLCYGLSLSNHTMMVIPGPLIGAAVLFGRRREILKNPARLLLSGLCFLAGLLPYAYLPLASAGDPALNWGTPSNWHDFIAHVMRKSYSALDRASRIPFSDRLLHIGAFARHLATEFTVPLFALGLWGLFLSRRDRTLLLLGAAGFATMSIVFPFYLNFSFSPQKVYVMRVYYINAYVVFALWIGMAAGGLESLAAKWRITRRAGAAVVLLPLLPLAANYGRNDRSADFTAYVHGMNIIDSLPEGAALVDISMDQDLFPALYLTRVTGKRPDLLLQDRYGLIFKREENKGDRPVFMIRHLTTEEEAERARGLVVGEERLQTWESFEMRYPEMFVRETSEDFMTSEVLALYHVRLAEDLFRRKMIREAVSEYDMALVTAPGSHFIATDVAESLYKRKLFDNSFAAAMEGIKRDDDYPPLWSIAGRVLLEKRLHEKAEAFFRKALSLLPTYAEPMINIGVIKAEQGDFEAAIKLWQEALAVDPANKAARENIEKARELEGEEETR